MSREEKAMALLCEFAERNAGKIQNMLGENKSARIEFLRDGSTRIRVTEWGPGEEYGTTVGCEEWLIVPGKGGPEWCVRHVNV